MVGRAAAAGLVELVERCSGHQQELAATALMEILLPSLERGRQGLAA